MKVSESNLKNFSTMLVCERAKQKITQEALATKSGVSPATICAIESGANRNYHKTTFFKIANALGISEQDVIELFNLEGE